jgi:hypothetical protein
MRWDIGSSEFQTPRGNFAVVSVAEIHQEAQAVYEIRLSDDSVVLTLWPGEEPEDGLWLVWIQDGEPTGRYFLRRQLPVVPVEKIT